MICLEERENKGKCRLESGIREKQVKKVMERFNVKGKFDIPKQTIFNCIKLADISQCHG